MGAACSGEPMPLGKVKIYYAKMLQSRGLCMAAICQVGGVDYEQVEIKMEEFFAPGGKEKLTIWGYMPEMELPDGTRVAEICAICQLLADYYPTLKGATAADNGISMMLGSRMNDFYSMISTGPLGPGIAMNMTRGMWEDPKQLPDLLKAYETRMETATPIIKKFEDLCLPAGKFTSTGTTWGEIFVWAFLYQFRYAKLSCCTPMPPKLAKFMDEMEKLDGVKAAIAGTTNFGEQGPHLIDAMQFKK
eukprot:CAMPEP_0197625470 /NCGR_PEP_ID=MMETSP1338-20131121/4829_1 /TAXON_ID=43686 ORGANISM="Pelagodinium beii, Strain RCC1491" /NCGR_SAMPLE_ID=MMETSP1338 /ASSEMBLY_ACC=CAM_ASM_000754 /LENGTH=246 /DNA_ID=CAMNT_0043195889 /DNA_START=65 /DNA_END=805 /DNA_ORIENTATION=+